jgi:hypothetical protein
MKLSATIVSRNDNYGGNLVERSTYCFNSMIETFDEVFYIDWNSETRSLLEEVKQNVKFKGNFHHVVVDPDQARFFTNYDIHAQKCCEVLGRNIGLRRSTGDWLISTNIDIIAPRRLDLENTIHTLDKNTFYTISRRNTNLESILKFHGTDTCQYSDWQKLRDFLIENSEERHYPEKAAEGDDYSIVNCCGDFQITTKEVWNEIKGMESDLIYPLYADTNVQKKAVKHGFGLKAIYNPALFHIDHGRGGGGFLTGINKRTNDPRRAIMLQEKTLNDDSWGFPNMDLNIEIL